VARQAGLGFDIFHLRSPGKSHEYPFGEKKSNPFDFEKPAVLISILRRDRMSARGTWGSRVGFILAAAGSAIGLGNIWRFPYLAGKHGGALFVLIYILAVLILGVPVMLAEFALGRATLKNPVGAFNEIRPGTKWKYVGYLGVVSGVTILSFYSVISGWTLGYFYKSLSGHFRHLDKGLTTAIFQSFTADPFWQIALLAAFIFLTIYIVAQGVSAGLERYSKILMPILFILLIVLLGRSLTLPGAEKGILFYLKPDFTKINGRVFLEAMGQAFFSLSLGMGAMLTYGSYLKKDENLVSATYWVVALDTVSAILAGFIVFPAIFSQNMVPDQGPGLAFIILPVIFSKIPLGAIFGALFFVLLAVAAIASTISILEVPVAFLIDEKKWPRHKATWMMGALSFAVGIPSALSGGGVKFFTRLPWLHMDFMSVMDKLWGNVALSIGSFFIAVFVAYVWKTSRALAVIESGDSHFRLAKAWIIAIKYVCPLLILVVLVSQFF
jgi:NSS family neurotransmitter:Na+ symporter